MPTPNRGLQASAMAQLSITVKILTNVLSQVGAETDVGQAVTRAISSLAKHVPPGSGSPGVEQTALQKMAMEQKAGAPGAQMMMGGGAGAPPMGGPQPQAA